MKEMNLPETQLRSWQPRRPSAGLKHRIFAAPHRTAHLVIWSLRRLTPVAACLLVALAAVNQGRNFSSNAAPTGFGPGMIGSNQIQIAYLPADRPLEENRVSRVTLEWTNRGSSTSSISSFSPGKVN
jgi:hypothetical protein